MVQWVAQNLVILSSKLLQYSIIESENKDQSHD